MVTLPSPKVGLPIFQRLTLPRPQAVQFGKNDELYSDTSQDRFELRQGYWEIKDGMLPRGLTLERLQQLGDGDYLNKGHMSAAYRVKNLPDHPLGVVVKVMHDPKSSYDGYVDILKKIPKSFSNSEQLLCRVKDPGGKEYLVVNFLPGQMSNARTNPLNGPQIQSLLQGLLTLDTLGIQHLSLFYDNFLTQGNKANIIDYGRSETVSFTDPAAGRLDLDYPYHEPPSWLPTNLTNFEVQGLVPHLRDVAQDPAQGNAKALDLYKDYLRYRADFHAQKAQALTKKIVDYEAQGQNVEHLHKSRKYELLQSNVLANTRASIYPEIINLEAARTQSSNAAEVEYLQGKLNRPLSDINWKYFSAWSARAYYEKVKELQQKAGADRTVQAYLSFQEELASYQLKRAAHRLQDTIHQALDLLLSPNLSVSCPPLQQLLSSEKALFIKPFFSFTEMIQKAQTDLKD